MSKIFGPKNLSKPMEDMGQVISEFHTERLAGLLKGHGGKVLTGVKETEEIDAKLKFIPPTVIENPSLDSPLMQEEIFGPILPIVTYKKFEDAIKFINDRPKPLSAYYFGPAFGKNHKVFETRVTAGGMNHNDVVIHCVNPWLPFGGVGASGMGKIHSQIGFKAMSNAKSVYWKAPVYSFPFNVFGFPFTSQRKSVISFFQKNASHSQAAGIKHIVWVLIALYILYALATGKLKESW